MANRINSRLSKRTLLFGAFIFLIGCGELTGGTTVAPNDPIPAGTINKQGQFFSQGGQTVTGSAIIYLSGSSYVLRLEGIQTPEETGLQVRINTTLQSPAFTFSLKGTSGNQNYAFTGPGQATIMSVNIFSTLSNKNYGAAQMN
jgi:hypothetical protein